MHSCIFTTERNYSYRELQALVNRIANVLVREADLEPGGRVLLRSANKPMVVAAYLAIKKGGRHRRCDNAVVAGKRDRVSDQES